MSTKETRARAEAITKEREGLFKARLAEITPIDHKDKGKATLFAGAPEWDTGKWRIRVTDASGATVAVGRGSDAEEATGDLVYKVEMAIEKRDTEVAEAEAEVANRDDLKAAGDAALIAQFRKNHNNGSVEKQNDDAKAGG